ncbi:MAG: TIGR00266 family protein [Phototrophicaceae bacterium]|jgi:uncharacterized protein (TIGR00266 family)
MRYEIRGTTMPALEVLLEKGESVFTETAGMSWMSQHVNMSTGTRGGLGSILGRAITGESIFLTTFKADANGQKVVFTPKMPGQIIAHELGARQSIIAQRDAFLCASDGVEIKLHLRKRLGAGIFGGEGFVMQRLTGPGTIFAEVGGEVMEYTLQPNEILKVNPGYVAMYEPSVDYDITLVRGISNWLFGGEGIFLATLKGPGKVWLQTMPLSNFAEALLRYLPIPSIVPAREPKAEHEDKESK